MGARSTVGALELHELTPDTFAGLTPASKLGLFPLWFWLPLLAESAPAVVAGLVIAIIDVAAFGEVVTLRTVAPKPRRGFSPEIALRGGW